MLTANLSTMAYVGSVGIIWSGTVKRNVLDTENGLLFMRFLSKNMNIWNYSISPPIRIWRILFFDPWGYSRCHCVDFILTLEKTIVDNTPACT